MGPVTAEDEAAGTLSILGVAITGTPGITEFEDENANVLSQAEFHSQVQIGSFVEADWDLFVNTDQPADQLSLEVDDD